MRGLPACCSEGGVSLEWGAQGTHRGPGPGATWVHSRASLLSQERVQRRQKGPGLEAAILKVFIILPFKCAFCTTRWGHRLRGPGIAAPAGFHLQPPPRLPGGTVQLAVPPLAGTFPPAAAAVSCPLSLVPGRGSASRRGRARHVRTVVAEDRAWGWRSCLEPVVSRCVQWAPWWGELSPTSEPGTNHSRV